MQGANRKKLTEEVRLSGSTLCSISILRLLFISEKQRKICTTQRVLTVRVQCLRTDQSAVSYICDAPDVKREADTPKRLQICATVFIEVHRFTINRQAKHSIMIFGLGARTQSFLQIHWTFWWHNVLFFRLFVLSSFLRYMVTCMEAQELHCFKCENPNKKEITPQNKWIFLFLGRFFIDRIEKDAKSWLLRWS